MHLLETVATHVHHVFSCHAFETFDVHRNLPSWPPQRQLYPAHPPTPPPLFNGCGWDGVKVITGPWIFVPTHFISVRLPTGKSMSSSLMKDLHLCPMGLLVFILSPNMVSMRSPDTAAHVSYSLWRCYIVMRQWKQMSRSQAVHYEPTFIMFRLFKSHIKPRIKQQGCFH